MSTPSTDDTRADAPLPTASHEPAADSPPPSNAQMRFGVTKRRLQIWLGCLWIIVGLFKFQPDLFGASFIQDVVGSMAAGQPGLIRVSITHMATFLSHEATWWVVVFGLVEIAIGVGMLVARTVKVALASSVVWGLAIYWFGEGFGGVFTGQASPLAGAPGAACFYALLAVVIWPAGGRGRAAGNEALGAEAASKIEPGAGLGSDRGLVAYLVWATIWLIESVLWLFPANRAPGSITSQLTDAASGEPHWYASFLHGAAQAFIGTGAWMSVLLAAASLLIALGPLFSRRPRVFVGIGLALTLVYWVTGEALGMIPTLAATDFSNGPIVALIGLWVLLEIPAAVAAEDPPLGARYFSRRPTPAAAAAIVLALVLVIVGAVPADGSASTGSDAQASSSSDSGMHGMSMSGSHSASSSHSGSAGKSMKGMSMSANPLLAPEAMGATDPSWHYFGPTLPAAEVGVLTTVGADTDRGHKMQTPSCTATPTAQQLEAAIRIVQNTSVGVAKYQDLSAATSDGYFPITATGYQVVHYLKPAFMNRQDMLDPDKVDSLVYATTPYGKVLVAAMYLMPRVGENGPMPAGCMVQWHAHSNLCTSLKTGQISGFAPCGPGESVGLTPYMAHVWQVPVPGGPLTLDPSDLQTVEAAIMAQQCGEAPHDPSTPPPPPAPGECEAYYGPNSSTGLATSTHRRGILGRTQRSLGTS